MKKLLMLALLLLSTGVFPPLSGADDQIDELEDRIQELEDQIEGLNDQVPSLDYQLPALKKVPRAQPSKPGQTRGSAPTQPDKPKSGQTHGSTPTVRAVTSGTGVLFNASPYVFTNYHVANGAKKIRVKFVSGESIQATVSYKDEGNDIAMLVLATLPKIPLKRLSLASASKVGVGEKVFTIGYPVSHILGKEPKYSEGVVNALSGVEDNPKMFQISVPIQAGNSGGPLFNEKGEVIGLVTSTFVTNEALMLSGALPQNVNFAVKSSLFADKALAQSKGVATTSIVPVPAPFSVSAFVAGVKNNIVLIEAE